MEKSTVKKVLVAGATGYLGQYLVKELKSRGYWVRILVRKASQKALFDSVDEIIVGEITKPETLEGICNDIDWVLSSVGITRQKDGLTYMDVDYQGNANLLNEAKKSGVTSFLYVSALNGQHLRQLKIFEAKERFVDELKASGLSYTVMRPSGFFSDMRDFLNMAKGGRVYLFGDGELALNPIDGADLAKVCIDSLFHAEKEVNVGGPDIFTQNELAALALLAWGNSPKVTHLPDFIRLIIIKLVRIFMSAKSYGPIEFFLTALALDNTAQRYGTHKLKDYFANEVTVTQR